MEKDKREMLSAYTSAGTAKNADGKQIDLPYGSVFSAIPEKDQVARTKYEWYYPGHDFDDVIEDYARLANPFEINKRVRFSMNGLVDYMEALLREESVLNPNDALASLWVEKLNTTTFKYWCKKEKSNLITMRMEMKYVKKFEIDKIAEFMFDPAHKVQWDKNIEEMTFTPWNANSVNFGRQYYRNKKQMALDSRDYDEKTFQVWHGNKLYRYSSTCYERQNAPNSGNDQTRNMKMSEYYKQKPKTVRADTLFSLMTIERDMKDDERIKITYVCSIDFQTQLPMAIVDPFMAKATQSWFSDFQKYYIKSTKKK